MDVFKRPLEEVLHLRVLLNATQIRLVFGNVPPILEVHSAMLAEFQALLRSWKEPVVIGKAKNVFFLLKTFEPYAVREPKAVVYRQARWLEPWNHLFLECYCA